MDSGREVILDLKAERGEGAHWKSWEWAGTLKPEVRRGQKGGCCDGPQVKYSGASETAWAASIALAAGQEALSWKPVGRILGRQWREVTVTNVTTRKKQGSGGTERVMQS